MYSWSLVYTANLLDAVGIKQLHMKAAEFQSKDAQKDSTRKFDM